MPIIKNYIQQDDGTITAVIEGVTLENKDFLLLDNGLEVECDVIVSDPYKITDKQRRKVFALCNDIEAYTGQPREYMREMFQDYISLLKGYSKRLSLSDCTRKQAGELIDVILAWTFEHDIPLNYKTSDLMKQDQTFLYLATVHRKCVICGRKFSDLAHRYAVGRGRNRNEIDHYGNEVLALCHFHHKQQHDMGIQSFNEKYHLENSWIPVNKRLNEMLKGRK